MKRILPLALSVAILFLAGCSKQDYRPQSPIDESYWLRQERAVVAYSDYSCSYFVLETRDGFSVLRSWSGFIPYRGSIMYGSFDQYGTRTVYNRSDGVLMQADVKEYWLSHWDAMDAMDWYCGQSR